MLRSLSILRALRGAIGSVGPDDELSTVGHLEELRTRLIVSCAVLAVAFGACFAENHRLLNLIDRPLDRQAPQQVRDGRGSLGAGGATRAARDVAVQLHAVVSVLRRPDAGVRPAARAALAPVSDRLQRDIARLSPSAQPVRPVTLGIGEPFTTTVTVSLVFALMVALPFLLYQAYAFLAPALDPADRRRARPLVLAIPFLFVTGVTFGYFVVLPAAVHFFANFNNNQFDVFVQAGPYYRFAATTVLAMGLVFEVPVAIVAVTRLGLVTPQRLRRSRRYAVMACGLVAAALPGDAVTLLLETVPLYLLYELGLLVATVTERRAVGRDVSVNISAAQ